MNEYMKEVFKAFFKTRGWWLNMIAIACAIFDILLVSITGYYTKMTAITGWICTALWAFDAWILEARIKIKEDKNM